MCKFLLPINVCVIVVVAAAVVRVTTCPENLEMSGIFTNNIGNVRGKYYQGKMVKSCLLLVAYLHPYGYLVASSYYRHDMSTT